MFAVFDPPNVENKHDCSEQQKSLFVVFDPPLGDFKNKHDFDEQQKILFAFIEDWLELIFESTWDPWIDGASLTFENPHRIVVTIN